MSAIMWEAIAANKRRSAGLIVFMAALLAAMGGAIGLLMGGTPLSPLLAGRDAVGVVHHCGSGVSAVPNVLAMELAGYPPAALYGGSWSEWSRTPGLPMAQGCGIRLYVFDSWLRSSLNNFSIE